MIGDRDTETPRSQEAGKHLEKPEEELWLELVQGTLNTTRHQQPHDSMKLKMQQEVAFDLGTPKLAYLHTTSLLPPVHPKHLESFLRGLFILQFLLAKPVSLGNSINIIV